MWGHLLTYVYTSQWRLRIRGIGALHDCFIISIYLFIIHLFLSINTYLNKTAIEYLNSYLDKSRGEVQSPSLGIWLQVLFWVISYIISY